MDGYFPDDIFYYAYLSLHKENSNLDLLSFSEALDFIIFLL